MVTTQVPAPRRRRGGREGTVSGATAVNVVLVVATIYFLLPLVWVLVAATKSPGDLFSSFGLWFSDSPQAWETPHVLSGSPHVFLKNQHVSSLDTRKCFDWNTRDVLIGTREMS